MFNKKVDYTKEKSIFDVCEFPQDAVPKFTDKENILLSSIASLLYYACLKRERNVISFIKVLNCIKDKEKLSEHISVFDCIFDEERYGSKHAAIVLYKQFKELDVQDQIKLRDECIMKLKPFINN